MLIDKKKIEKILDVIRKRHNLFIVNHLGEEFLSEKDLEELRLEYGDEAVEQLTDLLKDGYYVGYLRSRAVGKPEEMSHDEFTSERKPALDSFESYSLEHAKEVTDAYIQKLSSSARASFETLIQEYNKKYKDYLMVNVGMPMAILAQEENKTVGELEIAMRDLTGDMARDFNRIARTEISNIINVGMTDKIVKMNPDKKPDEIKVYKMVINDQALCEHCRRLHLMPDGKTPRVYTLDEALSNGSNVGRKARDWEFTVPVVHPHCFVDENVRIYVRDGDKITNKKIKDITPGDEVLTHKRRFKKVLSTLSDYPQLYTGDIYTFAVKYKSINDHILEILKVTPDHQFYTAEEGWCEAKDLKNGYHAYQLDLNKLREGKFSLIECEIRGIFVKKEKDLTLYDIEVEEDHSFFANGIVSHNCRCQLVQLPDGFTFDKNGKIEFVGEKEANERNKKLMED